MSTPRGQVSTCMATYNGAAYVADQIASILHQLSPDDELVVVDDGSTDDTVDIVLAVDDRRVHLHRGTRNAGHVAAFERAISEARGEYILLADQDDLWPEGRLDAMVGALSDSHFVAGNQQEFPARPQPIQLVASMRPQRWRNIGRLLLGHQAYFGCAMGLRREMVRVALPFPPHVEAHDHWLAVMANVMGSFPHLEAPVVLRRVHGTNLTPTGRRGWQAVARTRVVMLLGIAHALLRNRRRVP